MNHLWALLDWIWKRRQPKSRLRRYLERGLYAVMAVWALLLFFPHVLFAHSVRVGRFSIYSDEPIADSISTIVTLAEARLQTSPYHSPADRFSIHLANRRWRRLVLSPAGANAFGTSNLFTGHIVLNRCDVVADQCFNDMPTHNHRPLHSILAHECTHLLLGRRLGLLTAWRMPTWKNEGYCEYVAGDPSFEISRGMALLVAGRTDPSPAFDYLTYFLAVRHLLEVDGIPLERFVADPIQLGEVLKLVAAQAQQQ
jgi:hypothetical protein